MNTKQIIEEEIKLQSEKFNLEPKELKTFLNELFTFNTSKLLKNMGNQEEILDEKDSLPTEFWEGIIDNINNSYSEYPEDWEKELLQIKFQIICNKYFTKKNLTELSEIEDTIRVEIKKFFSSLSNFSDNEDFKNRFFNLPSALLVNFSRYLLNNSTELNKKLKISKEEVQERIKLLKKERDKIIKKLSFISNGNVTVLEIKRIKMLADNGVFYEDNFLNRAINEYLFKLINHDEASEKIIDSFNSTFINDLKKNVEESASYLSHITSVKNEETSEFFLPSGLQIGRKFDNEIELLKNKDFEDSIIDKDSIFKEPNGRINSTDFAWGGTNDGAVAGEDSEGTTAGGAGSGSGGGGFSGGGSIDSYSGPSGGSETVDVDGGEPGMPAGEDGFPTDFGTEDSNETVEGDAPVETKDDEMDKDV